MQRDLKVGLSLGVLVLGVVGALLFRREQVSVTHQPPLKTARKLDERIAEHARTPYMGDIEFEQDEASTAKSSENGLSDDDRPAHSVPPKWLDDEEDPFQVARTPNGNSHLARGLRSTNTDPIQVPPRAGSPNRTTASAQTTELQTHVIQSGESLSTIAAQYLGSQGRFQELYDANRDVLTDPNRLPLGTTIVIPARTKVARQDHIPDSRPLAAKPKAGQPEKARGTITDVSAIEPISPAGNSIATDRDAEPAQPADQVSVPTPVVPTQSREARKLFSPSRLPFSSNRTPSANRTRKLLDSEGEEIVAPTVTPATDASHARDGKTTLYQVRKGDSLEKISLKTYGSAKRAAEIFAANRDQLASPDAVREGQELVLPN